MMVSKKLFSLALALATALAVSEARAQSVSTEHLQGLGEVLYHRAESESLEQTYHVYVRLPESYGEQSGPYPTLYLLDGGVTFPLFAAYYRYLTLGEEIPELLVVGISYGTADWQKGNMRGRDFTAPAKEAEHYGGAEAFRGFLRGELMPLVESQYRSDSRRRIVFGQSLGGQFVLDTALRDPGLFWGHIASNPALHRNLELFLRPPAIDLPSSGNLPKLFVSVGSRDAPRFRGPSTEWIEHWSKQTKRPFDLETRILEGQGHFSAAPESLRQGLAWLF